MRCALGLILMLAACTDLTYWKDSGRGYIEAKHIVRVDLPCGQHILGCADLAANTIEIDRRLMKDEADCVIRHERKHFAGYDHPEYNWSSAAPINCGDGTYFTLTPMRREALSKANK